MKCFKCGAEVRPPARFCGICGTAASDPHESTLVSGPEEGDELLTRVRMILTGEYQVERELGRGGMAVVYQATEVGLGRVVALKVLPPDLGLTGRTVERFKREARTVGELEHPNIVPVYRVGQVGGVLHIVMKYVEGRPLDSIIGAQGALPIPVVLYVLRGVVRALAYAHDRGIVHRDVKGANILVDRDGRVMVSDFGVALRASDVTLTIDGSVIGTPPFMSPEQCSGRRAGPQSDQYSLGIVAFHMLSGAVPFHAETLAGIMQHHFFTPVPDLRGVRDDVPDALLDILLRALAKDPDQRFATTRQMAAAIEAIPFSEADRQLSERTLQQLSRGETFAPITTRSLPPLPDAPTTPIQLPVRGMPWSRRRMAAVGAVAAVVILALWWSGRPWGGPVARAEPQPADSPAVPLAVPESSRPATESRRAAPAPAPAPPPGMLRLLTTPPDAEIFIDDRRAGIGSLFDHPVAAGPRRLRIQAPGYRTVDSLIVIPSGNTLSLGRIILRDRDSVP
jgi:serine/threonine protein kinase